MASVRTALARAVLRPRAPLAQPSLARARNLSAATSNLPREAEEQIRHDALLPNADPREDSASAALTDSHLPYMVATYARPPPVFTKAAGSYLWDLENRRFVDFTSGIAVTALGHGDREFNRILADQAAQVIHTSNLYHNPWTGELSRSLVEKTVASGAMKDAGRVFICNSGSEANEAALKFARKVGKVIGGDSKTDLVSFHNSFHGRTMGSLSATPNPKYQKPFAPMVPGFSYGEFNNTSQLDTLITEKTCGVIVEPIQGEGGVNVATPEFLQALRDRCTAVGAVLIYDEIQCGMGRTGKLWAHSNYPASTHPDILTTAKALGNGFPIGATIVTHDVADKIVTGDHGTTFGGNPLASRLGHYVLSRLSDPALLENVNATSAYLRTRLDALAKQYPGVIKEVRGSGLILGVQLDRDPTELVKAARERGLLVITAGKNVLRLVPSLVIEREVLDEGLKILEDAVKVWIAESK
ncbi:acetylornithine aminotransferase mitochondrial precursor [Peziza echinospora]|nr:acetylornithine aminotransferase mitochondrial precursor [Peziza echinospora]